MAASLGELYIRIALKGNSEVVAGMQQVKRAAQDAAKGVNQLDNALDFAGAAAGLAGALAGLGASMAALSGLNLAARFQNTELALGNLLGSARKAHTVMQQLIAMGANTPFDTEMLSRFSMQLIATGSNAENVASQLQAIANAGANVGLSVSEVGEMALALGKLRMQSRAHMEAFTDGALSRINLAKTLAAGGGPDFTGRGAMSGVHAARYIASLPGPKAFDVLMKGLMKLNPKPLESFLSLVQNVGEQFRNVMLPTGDFLITVLTPLGAGLKLLASGLKRLNEATFGGAGLIFALGATAVAGATAVRSILLLNAALHGLAGSAALGAGGTAAAGGAAAAGGGILAFGGRLFAGIKGFFGKFGGTLFKGLGFGLLAQGLGGLVGIGAEKGSGRALLSDLIGNVGGLGAGGAAIGAMFGGVGGVVGGIAGAIAGLFKTIYDNTVGKDSGGKEDEVAKNTKRAADALEDLQSRLLGRGGPNAHRIVSDLEVELSLARALQMQGTF